jgi:hypothetical protein
MPAVALHGIGGVGSGARGGHMGQLQDGEARSCVHAEWWSNR